MLNHQQSVATGELALSVLVCRVLVPLSGTMRQMAAGRDRGAGRRPRSRARAISPRPLHDVSIVLAAPAAVSLSIVLRAGCAGVARTETEMGFRSTRRAQAVPPSGQSLQARAAQERLRPPPPVSKHAQPAAPCAGGCTGDL